MDALDTEDVLQEEAKRFTGGLSRPAWKASLLFAEWIGFRSAVLVGRGIRSASFSLGVVQALAIHPRNAAGDCVPEAKQSLLAKFHYVSTVSGGGYTGSWLSTWLAHEYSGGSATWDTVWKALAGHRDAPDKEPSQLAWLRTYSNYLTPKLGLGSADTWTGVALYIRNLVLNWFVILPVLCLLVLTLKLIAVALAWFSQFPAPQSLSDLYEGRTAIALGCCLGSDVSLIAAFAVYEQKRRTRGGARGPKRVLWCDHCRGGGDRLLRLRGRLALCRSPGARR